MNLLLLLVAALHASSYDAVRAGSPTQAAGVMTAAQYTEWVAKFKSVRAKAAGCTTLKENQLPAFMGPHRDEKIDGAGEGLYQPPFIMFAGRVEADVEQMLGPVGHSYEKPGCGLWDHLSELGTLKEKLSAHAYAVMTYYWRTHLQALNFKEMTPAARKAWLEGGYLPVYSAAVKAASDAGELDVVRQGLLGEVLVRSLSTAWAVADQKDKKFSPEMEKLLSSKDVRLRVEAAYFFGAIVEPRVMDKMAALAGDSDETLRLLVASYLGATKAVKHKAVLEKLKTDASSKVREAAEKNLKLLP